MSKEEQNYDDVWDELIADMKDEDPVDENDSPGPDSETDGSDTNDENNQDHHSDDHGDDNDEQDDSPPSSNTNEDDEFDWKTLYEKEKHRNASWEGRIRKEREEKEKAQAELEKLRAELESQKSPWSSEW